MRDRSSGHRIDVGLSVDLEAIAAKPVNEVPFSIALFGDFSGRPPSPRRDIREPVLVDRDNLDEVLALLRPTVRVPLPRDDAEFLDVQFTSIDDFHPDRLYERLPLFEGVRALRRRIAEGAPTTEPQRTAPALSGGNLLDEIVQQSASLDNAVDAAPLEGGDLQAYLNRIVAPHVVPRTDSGVEALLIQLQAIAANGLRVLLHLPEIQRLEALWRGVRLVTQAIESDANVQLYLFDLPKAELTASDRVHSLLAESPVATRGPGWSVLGGLYAFSAEDADIELLGQLGAVASVIKAPWLFAADWIVDPPPAWLALRRTPPARWVGLATPRFLLRLPYGERGSRCESLPFEELTDEPSTEEYLWGNPAIACLMMLLEGSLEIEGRTEVLLGERAIERLIDQGLMPLVSIRDTDRIRLLRIQSIADPPTPLGDLRKGLRTSELT